MTGASGQYTATVAPGLVTLRAFPQAGGTLLTSSIGPLNPSDGDIVIRDFILTLPVPIDTVVGVSPVRNPGGNTPSVGWSIPTSYTKDVTQHCGVGSPLQVKLVIEVTHTGGLLEQMMTNTGVEIWEATFPPFSPHQGPALLTFLVDCPPDTHGSPEDISNISIEDETQIGGHIYIDPSGTVIDTNINPISGATVTLLRSDTSDGPFVVVPDGSGVMSPSNRRNPDVTSFEGIFGWDVIAGFYKVRAEASGCVSPSNISQAFVETGVLTIPPPALNLDLVLDCLSPSLEAKPSFTLYQDPTDEATGFRVNIAQITEPATGSAADVLLGSFQARLTYDGDCVSVLDVRSMDFTITDPAIDNIEGVAAFGGTDVNGVPWPADLGHGLTRLNGSANQNCRVDLELTSLTDTEGNQVNVPPVLTQMVHRGDARADGVINIDDAQFIAQYPVGSRPACTEVVDTTCLHSVNAASVWQDGSFDQSTIADALFIAQHLVGHRDGFYHLVP